MADEAGEKCSLATCPAQAPYELTLRERMQRFRKQAMRVTSVGRESAPRQDELPETLSIEEMLQTSPAQQQLDTSSAKATLTAAPVMEESAPSPGENNASAPVELTLAAAGEQPATLGQEQQAAVPEGVEVEPHSVEVVQEELSAEETLVEPTVDEREAVTPLQQQQQQGARAAEDLESNVEQKELAERIPPSLFRDSASMRAFTRQHRAAGKTIALVPTMGCLHAGHLSLVAAARARADIVVVSIYVNPTQFSKNEDFGQYPRDRAADLAKLTEAGVDALFEPTSLYGAGGGPGDDEGAVVGAGKHRLGAHETFVQVEQLQQGLCGRSRPHFFRGVATVVAKLFNIVEPDISVFGRKDYQQWRVLVRMARDLDFAVQVIGEPIARQSDGVAMSSRNVLLTKEDAEKAPCIYAALQWAQQAAAGGRVSTASSVHHEVYARIKAGGGEPEYVEVVDANNLQRVSAIFTQPTLVAVAVRFGAVRLIDNVVLNEHM